MWTRLLLLISCFFVANANASMKANRDDAGNGIANIMLMNFINKHSFAECDNQPLYICNGLMVSGFEYLDLYWTWSNINKLSMSFVNNKNIFQLFYPTGFVLWSKNDIDNYLKVNGSKNTFIPVYRCAYPVDGNTGNTMTQDPASRSDHGCGMNNRNDPQTDKCQTLGINSVEQWWSKYKNNLADGSCAFNLTQSDAKQAFENMLGVHHKLQSELGVSDDSMMWNEIILQAWPENKPAQVPVMAIFNFDEQSAKKLALKMAGYKTYHSKKDDHADEAKIQQESYYKLTNIFVPIITISGWPKNIRFIYNAGEQSSTIPEEVNIYPE
ncbi:TPA: hypothetical protein ACQ39K_004573 [Yersinia enterocolitica]